MSTESKRAGDKVPSPCNSICALNDEDICVGCFRTALEISAWGRLSSEKQREVVALAAVRSRAQNPFA